MSRTHPLGCISADTLSPTHLFPKFIAALRRCWPSKELEGMLSEIEQDMGKPEWWDDSDAVAETSDYLQDELNCCAPDHAYFGASDGDGACFGFWPCMSSLNDGVRDGDVLKINAGDTWPSPLHDAICYVMEVSDHGNVTLYDRDNKEIWNCV